VGLAVALLLGCASVEGGADPDLPCIPGSTRCASVASAATCSDNGLAWEPSSCAPNEACLSALPGAGCEETASGERSVEQNLRAIARLRLHGGAICTAFFVTEDVLVTNNHCCPDLTACDGTEAETLVRGSGPDHGGPVVTVLETIASDLALDAAALRVTRPDLAIAPVIFELPRDLTREPVYVVGHPAGRPLESSLGIAYRFADEITYEYPSGPKTKVAQVLYWAQAEPGSSGSPVFSVETNALAMLHHTGGLRPQHFGATEDDTDQFTRLLGATDARALLTWLRGHGVEPEQLDSRFVEAP